MKARPLGWGIVVAVLAIAGVSVIGVIRRGFSTHAEPSAIERVLARGVRRLAIPAGARDVRNPVPLSEQVLADARAHYADHCASCHANDGSGHTAIGQALYPKAPDMRLDDTQRLTDGELYYMIQNGVRLTGMPAWGKGGDEADQDSWKLVHLIRHLKELTPEQIIEMKHLNPKSPDEIREEQEEEEFLRGGNAPAEAPPHVHSH
jgi:mono/diheme cytochrome c family protein